MYGQIHHKHVVYIAIVSTLHKVINLKHRSSYLRLDPSALMYDRQTVKNCIVHAHICKMQCKTQLGLSSETKTSTISKLIT